MKLLLSVAAVLAISAGSALAQQKGLPSLLPEELRIDTIIRLGAVEAVQKDLGLSDDVAHKLTVLYSDFQAKNKAEFEKSGVPSGFYKKTDEQLGKLRDIKARLNKELIPKAMELLSADQVNRFHQIQLQGRLRLGPSALLAPAVASDLKLTDEQKRSLTALHAEMQEKRFPGGRGATFSKEGQEDLRNIATEYAAKAVELLTAEQKEVFNKLKGKEFDLSKLPGS